MSARDRNDTNFISSPKEMEIFTREEVAKHNTDKSCWIIANEKVYDVTDWLKYHPAGTDCILKKGGQDCTVDFYFHSKNAIAYWKQYQIGYTQDHTKCIIF